MIKVPNPTDYTDSRVYLEPIAVTAFNQTEHISIKYYNNTVPKLKKIQKGDWIDLYAATDEIILEGETKLINLGIAMQLPKGFEAHILPRSSTFKNWGIIMTNSQGIVDETYNGDNDYWKFSAYCLDPKDEIILMTNSNFAAFYNFMTKTKFITWIMEHLFKWYIKKNTVHGTIIKAGDKIAQFRIMYHMPKIEFNEVEKLNNKDRGGFGSTGKI